MILYAKLGLAGAILLAIFGLGFHWGGASARAAAERLRADQLQAVVTQMDLNAKQAQADHDHLQGVIDAYHATPIDPIVPGIAHRVYVYASRTECPVPQSPSVASGTQIPTALPGSAGRVEQALAAYIDACAADSKQLNAVIQLAP